MRRAWGSRLTGSTEKSARYSRHKINKGSHQMLKMRERIEGMQQQLTRWWVTLDNWRRRCQDKGWIPPVGANILCDFSVVGVLPPIVILYFLLYHSKDLEPTICKIF